MKDDPTLEASFPIACIVTSPYGRAGKAVAWRPKDGRWIGRPAPAGRHPLPTTLSCPKCGKPLRSNVIAYTCEGMFAKPAATCDYSTATGHIRRRASISAPKAFDSTLMVLLARHGITSKIGWENWRMTARLTGEINGLPASRGVLVATNGIMCLIEQRNAEGQLVLFEGHVEWFEPDGSQELDGAPDTTKHTRSSRARERLLKALEIYE